MDEPFKRKKFHLITLVFILLILIIPDSSLAQEESEIIPLGTESWKLPEFHRIYVQELPTEEDPAVFETKLVTAVSLVKTLP